MAARGEERKELVGEAEDIALDSAPWLVRRRRALSASHGSEEMMP
jgi:hypothetical protein